MKSNNDLFTFAKAYIKTMRLYYSFITGIAGWIGVSFYFFVKHREHLKGVCPDVSTMDYYKGIIVLVILFLSWGINQVFNDWLGLPEDRINAPHRPMVSGELNIKWALCLSFTLMTGAGIFTFFYLNPWSLIPFIGGFLLNFVYEYSKAWGLWGNVIFGIMIAMCTVYGFMAIGVVPGDALFTSERISGFALIALMNGLMTYFTYFKDYEGDKAAGKTTFIVKHGVEFGKKIGIIATFLPTILFFTLRLNDLWPFPVTSEFIFCGVMTIFLQFWTAIRFYKNPVGPRAYFSNATNFRACACGQVTIIAIFNGTLALYLFNATYIFIGFLFGLYDDPKS